MNGAYIGFINTGIFCAMLAGAFIANRMSDRLSAGPVVCVGFLFSCLAMVPLVCTSNYWVMLICNSLSALPFPIINAMMLGFVFAKTPDSMQGRITVTLTVPAQALSMFCSAAAGSLSGAQRVTAHDVHMYIYNDCLISCEAVHVHCGI